MDNYFTNTLEWLNRAQKIAGIGIWNQDVENNLLWWSDETYRIFGIEPQSEKMNFEKFIKMVHPDYREIIIEKTRQFLLSDKKPYNAEYVIIRKDNLQRIILEEALMENGKNGKPKQIIGIIKDITKQKELENKLLNAKEKAEKNEYLIKKQNEELQAINENLSSNIVELRKAKEKIKKNETKLAESNKTKDKFFSIISHDLKSPFTAILGFSKILLKKHKIYDDEKREKIIKSVNDSANSAFKLLENLLTWSRSQAGKITYTPEKLHLKILVTETIYELQASANQKEIQLTETIYDNEIIFADKNMITTILRNLISNAIKFTPKNGNITIASEKQENSNFVKISVIDTGVGIPNNKIDDLFRIDKNTSTQGTENEAGTGLGLILCKEFVEKHNGKIWIESEEWKGSRFHFTISK